MMPLKYIINQPEVKYAVFTDESDCLEMAWQYVQNIKTVSINTLAVLTMIYQSMIKRPIFVDIKYYWLEISIGMLHEK